MAKATEEKSLMAPDRLKKISTIGMRKVDPMDIRPPQILLVQKTSDLENMIDKKGKKAIPGQFYHTAKKEILDNFECYFLFAAKSEIENKFSKSEKDKIISQYKSIGALEDDLSTFGMTFKSSALYALSSLFSTAQAQHAPMFAFKCKLESKRIDGEKGSWYVPVVRVGEMVNEDKFEELYQMARQLDAQTDKVTEAMNEEEDSEEGRPF